mmetsp:Transcript_27190/g.56960  ORF Transcript_27190/g.56960 Transcript_27190/m.56960 type:complete len:97 (+) Transcript_27190:62-352(+)
MTMVSLLILQLRKIAASMTTAFSFPLGTTGGVPSWRCLQQQQQQYLERQHVTGGNFMNTINNNVNTSSINTIANTTSAIHTISNTTFFPSLHRPHC